MAPDEHPAAPSPPADDAQTQDRVAWHPPYIGGLLLELWDYRDVLRIDREVQLTAEPLIIDGVVYVKRPGVVIDKNFARIFRVYNIIELKGPTSGFSVHDFNKCCGYVFLYAERERVDLEEITLTVIEGRRPRDLLEYLTGKRRWRVGTAAPGVYVIEGNGLVRQPGWLPNKSRKTLRVLLFQRKLFGN